MHWARRGHDREANCAGMMGSHMAKREGHPSASPSDRSGMLHTLLFPYMCMCVWERYACVHSWWWVDVSVLRVSRSLWCPAGTGKPAQLHQRSGDNSFPLSFQTQLQNGFLSVSQSPSNRKKEAVLSPEKLWIRSDPHFSSRWSFLKPLGSDLSVTIQSPAHDSALDQSVHMLIMDTRSWWLSMGGFHITSSIGCCSVSKFISADSLMNKLNWYY